MPEEFDEMQMPSSMMGLSLPKYHVDLPVGAVIAFAGDITENVDVHAEFTCKIDALGMMPCDGRQLKASDYPELFGVLGHKYGGKDDVFNVPDYKAPESMKGIVYIIKFTYHSGA